MITFKNSIWLTRSTVTASLLGAVLTTATPAANASASVLQFSAATYTVNENSGSISIPVTLSAASSTAVSVNYATEDGTGHAGAAYSARGGTLNWAAGSTTSGVITVPILNEQLTSGTQTFKVILSSPSANASLGSVSTATVTIEDNDTIVIQLSSATYTVTENSGSINIPVNLSAAPSSTVSVDYATEDGTGHAGAAYSARGGVLTWSAGSTTADLITVPILDQKLTTGAQTFKVILSSPSSNASLGTVSNTTVTIADNDGAISDANCHPNVSSTDTTASYCTSPNFPTYGTPTLPLPANSAAEVGDGLVLASTASNLFSLVMGTETTGANMTTGQSVRNAFYMNYITGDLDDTIGSPIDTGHSDPTFAAVARHYEVGDPNDVHLMSTDGLHLRAWCSQNHTNCSTGNVFAGMIRVPAEIRPGMTVKVRYKSPVGLYSWAPIWMFSGSEYSPGPGGNPYTGYGTTDSLVHLGTYGNEFEIDLNDNFSRANDTPSTPTGEQLDYGTPNGYGVTWNVAPHPVYWANGNGYTYQPGTAPPYDQLPINWSSGFHDLVLSWETDNLLYIFVDGKLATASYMEYPALTYVDGLDSGVTKTVAMNLMIGNQAIPDWIPGASTTTENGGVTDGWTIVVQEISVWNGNVTNPTSYEPAPNGCDTACQTP